MDRQQLLDHVRNHILRLNAGLYPDEVTEFASMTYDLGMDSFYFESLISNLKEEVADIEFTPWYIRASRRGCDTVGSLVDYIEEHFTRQAEEAREREAHEQPGTLRAELA
jgi:acyl carrier protein